MSRSNPSLVEEGDSGERASDRGRQGQREVDEDEERRNRVVRRNDTAKLDIVERQNDPLLLKRGFSKRKKKERESVTMDVDTEGVNVTQDARRQTFKEIMEECYRSEPNVGWMVVQIVIVFTGLFGNGALLWLLLKGRKALTVSKVLGLNLAIMDILYLLMLPLCIYADNFWYNEANPITDQAETENQTSTSSQPQNHTKHVINTLVTTSEAFSMFNLLGCPLFLTCMCLERYLAVARPVLYLRARRWENRAACCALVWAVTTVGAFVVGFVSPIQSLMIPLVVTISCLYVVMVACLRSMIRALWRQSPAHGGGDATPLRRRAVWSVLIVLVPSVVSYGPVALMIVPLVLIQYGRISKGFNACFLIKLLLAFPKLAVYIGPMFYLMKAKQAVCACRVGGKNT